MSQMLSKQHPSSMVFLFRHINMSDAELRHVKMPETFIIWFRQHREAIVQQYQEFRRRAAEYSKEDGPSLPRSATTNAFRTNEAMLSQMLANQHPVFMRFLMRHISMPEAQLRQFFGDEFANWFEKHRETVILQYLTRLQDFHAMRNNEDLSDLAGGLSESSLDLGPI